MIKNKLP